MEYLDLLCSVNYIPSLGYSLQFITSDGKTARMELSEEKNEQLRSLANSKFAQLSITEAEKIGRQLYDLIFSQDAKEILEALFNTKGREKGLRIRFANIEDDIYGLPLEFLYSDQISNFLCADPSIAIFIANTRESKKIEVKIVSKLRVLYLDGSTRSNSIEINTDGIPVKLNCLLNTRRKQLSRDEAFSVIDQFNPNILHIRAEIRNERIALSSQHDVDLRALVAFLRDKQSLTLLVIENIDAESSVKDARTVASLLLRSQVPGILILSNASRDPDRVFLNRFYSELLENNIGRFDIAVAKAQNDLYVRDPDKFVGLLPNAYVQSDDFLLFKTPQLAAQYNIYLWMRDHQDKMESSMIIKYKKLETLLVNSTGLRPNRFSRLEINFEYSEVSEIDEIAVSQGTVPEPPNILSKFMLFNIFSTLSRFSFSKATSLFLALSTILLFSLIIITIIDIVLIAFDIHVGFPAPGDILLTVLFVFYGFFITVYLDRFRRR